MLRTLAKRGLQIEAFCKSRDTTGRGLINKKAFTSMLRNLGLPFVPKDLGEIATRYTVPSSDMVDYETLLKDAGILSIGVDLESEGGGVLMDGQEDLRGTDVKDYPGTALISVKRMLLESVHSLGKQKEDVYRMFAQWDADGTGTVTATQFLRVLARLHVDLSDQDQDLVVELLDINAKGRIDFIALMTFCFADVDPRGGGGGGGSPINSSMMHQAAGLDDATNGETLSAISAEALRDEQRSVGSGNGTTSRRPHTATSTRPVAPDNMSYQRSAYSGGGSAGEDRDTLQQQHPHLHQQHSRGKGHGGSSSSGQTAGGESSSQGGLPNSTTTTTTTTTRGLGQRPLTASARVSTNQHEQNAFSTQQQKRSGARGSDSDQQQQQHHERRREGEPTSGGGGGGEVGAGNNTQLVMQLPDDVIDDDDDDDDDLMLLTPHSMAAYNNRAGRYDDAYSGGGGGAAAAAAAVSQAAGGDHTGNNGGYGANEGNDGASFNDNTLVTDQDEYFFGSPQGNLTTINSRDMWNSQSLDGLTASQDNQPSHQNLHHAMEGGGAGAGGGGHVQWAHQAVQPPRYSSFAESRDGPVRTDPNEHLALLATQTLATVREMIISRHRGSGKSLEDIFLHFDRRNNGFFDAQDFIQATLDLRIETSERVAQLAIQQIAIDGGDNVSLGEFKVFVMEDSEQTFELEENVQLQMAKQLEKQGRKFQNWLYNIFWDEDESFQGQKTQAAQTGLVSRWAFLSAFQMLGLVLPEQDLERLVTRFDIHGNGSCNVTRFLQMAQSSSAWGAAEKNLALQEEAVEEAATLRHQIRETGIVSVPEEVIAMAEYLGIRVISEQHILWIARDALKAPLPINWTAQRDTKGRVFFYNHITNQSRWDHPSDPHFRSLRDKYRLGHSRPGGGGGTDGADLHVMGIPGTISFGGVGASISPPPLNIHLLSAAGARPVYPSTSTSAVAAHVHLPLAHSRQQQQQQQQLRPNSAGALLGHGLAARNVAAASGQRQRMGSGATVLPPAIGATPLSSLAGGVGGLPANGVPAGNRPRPQSALLPERGKFNNVLFPFPGVSEREELLRSGVAGRANDYGRDGGVLWRDGNHPSAADYAQGGGGEDDNNILYSLHHTAAGAGTAAASAASAAAAFHRPSSAPNFMTYFAGLGFGGMPQQMPQQSRAKGSGGGFGKVELPGAVKKFSTDAIYRAPYFDLGHFKKDGDAGGGGGMTHSRSKKGGVSMRSGTHRGEGSGSHSGHMKKLPPPRAQTAVDRAVNFGKDTPSYLLPRTQDPREKEKERKERSAKRDDPRLAAVYDDAFLQRLGGGGVGGGFS